MADFMWIRESLQAAQAAALKYLCGRGHFMKGRHIGNQEFTLSVYPASMPIYMELIKNGSAATILETELL